MFLTLYRLVGMFYPMALHLRSDSDQTRQHILVVASSLALQGGAQALTIDGVAREAKMSKGGVLYHFRSKEELIKGMMRLHLLGFWDTLHRFWKADSRRPGRWHRAWIQATFEGLRRLDDLENPALFSMVHSCPEHILFLRRQLDRVQRCLDFDGLEPVRSRLLTSSVAGLRYDRMFRICWVEPAMVDALEEEALQWLEHILVAGTGRDS